MIWGGVWQVPSAHARLLLEGAVVRCSVCRFCVPRAVSPRQGQRWLKGGPAGPCTKQGAAAEGGRAPADIAAVVEPAAGKRATSAGWLVSASDVLCAEGTSETPRLQAAGKVPTVAAQGSRAPRGAATKHTEQFTHQAAIWAALVYTGQCLAKGRRVTLTVESVTALRNLHAAPKGASTPQEEAARGGAAEQPPQRHGAARPAESNGNKRHRPNPRPDLKRGRDDGA